MDLSIENGDFPSLFVCLPEDTVACKHPRVVPYSKLVPMKVKNRSDVIRLDIAVGGDGLLQDHLFFILPCNTCGDPQGFPWFMVIQWDMEMLRSCLKRMHMSSRVMGDDGIMFIYIYI